MARFSKAAQERIAGYDMDEQRNIRRDFHSLKTFAVHRPTATKLEENETEAAKKFYQAQRFYR